MAKSPVPRAGRPTRAEQAERQEELLTTALDMFLEHGFEQTTIEEIAAAVGMSKRTVYARYEDKSALFKAAVRRAIELFTIPRATLQSVLTGDLKESLTAIARLRIHNLAIPVSYKLQRILTAQSYRFPELFAEAFEKGTGPAIDTLCALFARHAAAGEVEITDMRRAAISFLSLVVGGPARFIVSGIAVDDIEMEERIRFAVGLFLNGVRKR